MVQFLIMKTCFKCKTEKTLPNFYKHKGTSDGYLNKCKKCTLRDVKRYAEENSDKISEYQSSYKAKNKAELKKNARIYKTNRRNEVPEYKVLCNLRRRMHHALNGMNKSASTRELLGCNDVELRGHLEYQFSAGMTWENYGRVGWHIDHIIPCSSFNLIDEEQQKECFHYNNLQPLWATENRMKSNKVGCNF